MDSDTDRRREPTQARSKFTVDAIIEASETILAQRGLEGTNTTAIAALAGVSIGTLYQYFPNKGALVAAVIEAHIERDLEALEATMGVLLSERPPRPLGAALTALAEATAGLYLEAPALYREMVAALEPLERTRRVDAVIEAAIAGVRALLTARTDEHDHPDPERAAWIYVHTGVQILRVAVREHPAWVSSGLLREELERMTRRYLGLARDLTPEAEKT